MIINAYFELFRMNVTTRLSVFLFQGCHLAFLMAKSANFGLFETVCQKYNGLVIWQFFWPF